MVAFNVRYANQYHFPAISAVSSKTFFVLKISFVSDSKCCVLQKNTSDGLLGALFNIQSAMLFFMELNEDSSTIQQTHVKVLVRR